MTLIYEYEPADELLQSRTLALQDAVQHVRRAAAALTAATCGEYDEHRLAARLDLVLRDLLTLGNH
jgi:hypothetical protein